MLPPYYLLGNDAEMPVASKPYGCYTDRPRFTLPLADGLLRMRVDGVLIGDGNGGRGIFDLVSHLCRARSESIPAQLL